VIHGEQPAQGKRRKFAEIADDIASGELTSVKDIAAANPAEFVRHARGFEHLLSLNVAPRTVPPKVRYIWGPSGSGKTLSMYRELTAKPAWMYGDPFPDGFFDRIYVYSPTASSSGTQWFRGLTPTHETLVIEEFSSHSFPLTFLTSLINPGPCLLPTLGGLVQCRVKTILILSNTNPELLYPNVPTENRMAMLRRLKDPNVGTIQFLGYGPNRDLPFCPCPSKATCPFVHDDSGPVALAVGARLPPTGGFLFKPRV